MIVLLVCNATTADHPPREVIAAVERVAGWPAGHRPACAHEHSDAPPFRCVLVRAIDEAIPPVYPHTMKDGTVVADGDAYLAYCKRYAP